MQRENSALSCLYPATRKTVVSIEDLTLENIDQYLPFLLNSEKEFPEQQKSNLSEIIKLFQCEKLLSKVALLDRQYIGNALGFGLTPRNTEELNMSGIPPSPQTVYLYNFVINRDNQGKGFGKQLLNGFLETARQEGYTALEGYFSPASLPLMRKLRAQEVSVHPNQLNTGQTYVYCRLDLTPEKKRCLFLAPKS